MLPTIVGHDDVFERFQRAVARGRLASTFLFVGPPGIGKKATAIRIAQALLCESNGPDTLNSCGHCEGCTLVASSSHPDLEIIQKPEDKTIIPVSLFIGDDEHRMREGLCHSVSLKPFRGGRKVAIIDDADHLNVEGANCLLKTLEEPPPKSVLILIGTSEQKQLPTIRSRCQIVRFKALPMQTVAQLLLQQGAAGTPEQAHELATLAEGSLQRAAELSDGDLREFRHQLYGHLSTGSLSSVELAKEVTTFVEQAGKETPPRRARLRHVMRFASDFFHELMTRRAGGPPSPDELLRHSVEQMLTKWRGEEEQAAACVERCIEAELQLDAMANVSTLVDCWVDDFWSLLRAK